MSIREQILESYKVREGTIVSPGKFEGEPIYAPHYWDAALDGFSDEQIDDDGKPIDVFLIGLKDRFDWPEFEADTYALAIWESDQGFVCTRELTRAEYREFQRID